MRGSPLDCKCGHPAHRHTEKVWPNWTQRCTNCNCQGYSRKPQPIYTGPQEDDDPPWI